MMGSMSTARFVVAFDGPGVNDGTIDVRDLAPALLSISKAVDAANRALHGDRVPARIHVKATAVGCFEVDLNLILSGWEAVKGLLLSEDAQAAVQLLTAIGFMGTGATGLIQLYRWLDGRRIESATQEGSLVTITAGGQSFTIPLEVLRLYQEIAVNHAIGELLDTLSSERVDRIEFRRFPGASPDQVLTEKDRETFSLPVPQEETVIDETRRMALSIRSLAFQEANKWRLYDGQNIITARIDDKDFLAQVDRNEIRFAKSDVLICMVNTIQKQGVDGLKTEHIVVKVLEYKPAPYQIDIFAQRFD